MHKKKFQSQLHMVFWSIIILCGIDWTHLVADHDKNSKMFRANQSMATAAEFENNTDEGLTVANKHTSDVKSSMLEYMLY